MFKTNIYYDNICKHKHEKNMTSLWCNIVLKTGIEQTRRNERSTSISTLCHGHEISQEQILKEMFKSNF
jgi:hypothetical protein